MGCYWRIYNFDKRQRSPFGGKLNEWLYDTTPEHYIKYITAPRTPITPDFLKGPKPSNKKKRKRKFDEISDATPIQAAFASEIVVRTILENLDDVLDVVHFTLVNVFIGHCGVRRLGEIHEVRSAPWVGNHLICLGDSGLIIKSMPKILKPRVEELKDEIRLRMPIPPPPPPKSQSSTRTRYHRQCKKEPPVEAPKAPDTPKVSGYLLYDEIAKWEERAHAGGNHWLDSRDLRRRTRISRRDPQREHFDMLVSLEFKEPKGPRMLCNLSKREYVREGPLWQLCKNSHNTVTLGEALVCRICWTDEPYVCLGGEGQNMPRGAWSGDRFVVTTANRVPDLADWTDVTKDVVEELKCYWSFDNGDDWPNNARQ